MEVERILGSKYSDFTAKQLLEMIDHSNSLTNELESLSPTGQLHSWTVKPGFWFEGERQDKLGSDAFEMYFETRLSDNNSPGITFIVQVQWQQNESIDVAIVPGYWPTDIECAQFSFIFLRNIVGLVQYLEPARMQSRIRIKSARNKSGLVMSYWISQMGMDFISEHERLLFLHSWIEYLWGAYAYDQENTRISQYRPMNYLTLNELKQLRGYFLQKVNSLRDAAMFQSKSVIGREIGWFDGMLGKEYLLSGEWNIKAVLFPNLSSSPGMKKFAELRNEMYVRSGNASPMDISAERETHTPNTLRKRFQRCITRAVILGVAYGACRVIFPNSMNRYHEQLESYGVGIKRIMNRRNPRVRNK